MAGTNGAARVPLVDEVAGVLRERIYNRRYPTGTWLRQEQLSAELEISRTPLREAFRALEREGLVQVVAGRGARVVSGDRESLLAAYELRAVVDGLAARLAAERASTSATRLLETTVENQRAVLDRWDPNAYTSLNVEFHEQIMHLSGNDFVVTQMPILRLTAQVFAPVAVVEQTVAVRAVDEHSAITAAISAGDTVAAEQLARRHIENTMAALRSATR